MLDLPSGFSEASPESWSREREALLQKTIRDLGLKLEGTRLEKLVERLVQELEAAGLKFKPRVYLSNEWSCPDGIPVIGIPFYLADKKLALIEDEMMEGIEAETDEEIVSYLRHEAGHAFNYAYKLFETEEWHQLFGPFSRPYQDDYVPQPFSRNFVRHIPGWYAQKHPDEDFAETFAVWLTPGSDWREVYREWGCYKKLLYVERTMKRIGQSDPTITGADFDPSGDEDLKVSLAEHYKKNVPALIDLPAHFDEDLKQVFETRKSKGGEGEPAEKFLGRHRRQVIRDIAYWTGLYEPAVRSLIVHFIGRSKALGLKVEPGKEQKVLMEVIAFATTLCMNKLYKGDYLLK